MKHHLLRVLTAVIGMTLFTLFFISRQKNTNHQFKKEADKEDGIRLAQEREFKMTKDPALGYVPRYRLINSIENLKRERQQSPGSTNRIESLSWTERGSYTDAVGPSNGNGRPGTPTPITSGRMRAVWVDLADGTNKTVWVGGIDGGIWKTTDITASPATWTLVNDFLDNLSIASICQDPSNTNTMYFGTGEKTFNIDEAQGGGVWKSTDHGVTWNLLTNTIGFWNVSKVLCDASGNVYVGTVGSGQGLQRSADGGSTWTNITPTTSGGGTRIADMDISSTGRLHVSKGYQSAANQFGYFYTDNPGTVTSGTWTQAATPFSSQYNVDIAVTGNVVYVLPSNSVNQTPTVYKSTDGGVNWSATSSISIAGNNAVSSGQAWYCLAIGVDPNNTNNVIVGGLNCYRTTNGGTTWSQISAWVSGLAVSVYIHADQHFVAWNGNQVLIGSDGGIFYSADGGSTFTDRNANLRLKQFYSCAIHPGSTNYFLAGAQDNGVHQFNGAGLTNSVEVSGGDGAFVAIDQDQPSYQFGSYVYNHYHRSIDGGNTWTDFDFYDGTAPANFTNFGSFINPFDYDDAGNAMYCGADAGQFFRWTNPQTLAPGTYHSAGSGFPAGVSQVAISNFLGIVSAVAVSPYTSNRVYFGTDTGRIIRVDNANTITSGSAGTNLTESSFPHANISCINLGTNDNNLIATFSNYGVTKVWVSTNGGTNWTAIDGNLPDVPVRWAMFYPSSNTRAFLATEMGVFETTLINGGSTVWTQDGTFPVVRTDMLQYRSSDRTLVAATHGRGLWTAIIPIVLPVTLLDFHGQLNNNNVVLGWSTSSEQNSKYFEVQKSDDGVNFYPIGMVNAAGFSTSQRNYELIDKKVNELNYYFLKMVDIDGRFVYSRTILIKNPNAQQNVWVVNNPFQTFIKVRFAKIPRQKVQFDLVSLSGVKLYHKEYGSSNEIILDISAVNLPAGAYLLRTNADGQVFTSKLVKK